MKIKAVLLFTLLLVWGTTEGQTLKELHSQSVAAHKAKDYPEFQRLNLEALKIHPSHPSILYNLAVSQALNGELETSYTTLVNLLSWKSDLEFESDADLSVLVKDKKWEARLKNKKNLFSKTKSSSTPIAVLEKKYHLEDVLKIEHNLYLTDVRHGFLLEYDVKKQIAKELMRLPGAAMAIIQSRSNDHIWVSSSMMSNYIDFKKEEEHQSFLYKINVRTSTITAKIPIPNKSVVGSMVLLGNTLYATNSVAPEILVINIDSHAVEKVVSIKSAFNLQGVTLDHTGNYLYVADYIKGIAKIDPKNPQDIAWSDSKEYLLKGIDGLTYVDETTLIGIQNNSTPKKVIKITHHNLKVSEVTLLDNALPLHGEPTNGKYSKEEGFLYIANSPWPFYDRNSQPDTDKWPPQEIRALKNF